MNKNALKNKIQHYKVLFFETLNDFLSKRDHTKIENEKADEASRESFPASDPPAHFSKSTEDRQIH